MVSRGERLRYMLDTNIWIYLMNGRDERVMRELAKHNSDEICISSIAYAELRHGMEKSKQAERNLGRLEKMLLGVAVLPFDEAAAQEYGRVRASLEQRGVPIGANDCLIAAHANSLDLTLVTHNVREFSRVDGLEVADWTS